MADAQSYLDLNGLMYYNQKISALLSNKVDKVNGKVLSDNNYTDADKTKLAGVDEYADVNVIESISVNGVNQTITNKGVNILVPTNNNQLTNGAGYQTSSEVNTAITNSLASYKTSAEVDSAIATAISGSLHLTKELVNTLPASGQDNVIYLVPNGKTGNNVKDEYMWINNAWEKTGSSDIDLSGYVQKSEITTITNAQIDTIVNG